jgi:hypothetical protein
MNETVLLAVLTGGCALLGSAITGYFTLLAAVKQREIERYKRKLVQAYKDIAAFHRLEERYTRALESETKTAEAWKRELRKQQRDEGFDSPSEDATAQKSDQRRAELGA